MNMPYGTMTSFLRCYAPDFCWMTAWDLFLMYEQIDEDANWDAFKIELSRCKKRGYFICRPTTYKPYQVRQPGQGKGRTSMYLRVK